MSFCVSSLRSRPSSTGRIIYSDCLVSLGHVDDALCAGTLGVTSDVRFVAESLNFVDRCLSRDSGIVKFI